MRTWSALGIASGVKERVMCSNLLVKLCKVIMQVLFPFKPTAHQVPSYHKVAKLMMCFKKDMKYETFIVIPLEFVSDNLLYKSVLSGCAYSLILPSH